MFLNGEWFSNDNFLTHHDNMKKRSSNEFIKNEALFIGEEKYSHSEMGQVNFYMNKKKYPVLMSSSLL